ncbi:hypothetical protein B0H15DRAFT_911338 [Mycena belliarum]|uniref:Mitochondrial intermembrane space import and assembly protein 40 n=1 Tax=Mycena belliarum TaxID=1033014 RepID=A0AAD6XP31_9AGAR|nr:hypothetical protein B0H15DRAFT_911338 [Mycena belliae]
MFRLSRARVPPLTRYIRSQSARPRFAASNYAMVFGAIAAAAVAGTVWSPRPIALDSAPSRGYSQRSSQVEPSKSLDVIPTPPAAELPPPDKSQPPVPSTVPPQPPESMAKTKDDAAEDTDADSAGDSGGGAYNPETGEINWDCPCLGGMADGPCGPEFRAAFSCFIYSEDEPKGINCVEKFQGMQSCFREHPEVYASEIADDEAAEETAEEEAERKPTDKPVARSTPSEEPSSSP